MGNQKRSPFVDYDSIDAVACGPTPPAPDAERYPPFLITDVVQGYLNKLDREGPPCWMCEYWGATVETITISNGRSLLYGVHLCNAPGEQEKDFSCFKPKAKPQ